MSTLPDLPEEPFAPGLDEADLDPDPIRQFGAWLAQAEAAGLPLPDAATLATATPDGRPSARMVLVRGFDERGFVFFTNYESRKGQELAANPQAALAFYWAPLERQVRVEGLVERASAEESDRYFETRPLDSRLGAWASDQSQVIPHRQTLERRIEELRARFPDRVPRPPHWGGYRVMPLSIEFWQGRPGRLHDRLRYVRLGTGAWQVQRLAP
jgi:pyridoxamine 5'-phosphate oxidase